MISWQEYKQGLPREERRAVRRAERAYRRTRSKIGDPFQPEERDFEEIMTGYWAGA